MSETEHRQDLAALSRGTYYDVEKAREIGSEHGYSIDDGLTDSSERRSHTLFHNDDGNAVLAFRGTDVKRSRGQDLLTDLGLLFGVQRKEIRQAARIAQAAKEQYGDNLMLAGHSLGGSKAILSGKKHGIKSVVFNPFVAPSMSRGLKKYYRETGSDAHVHVDDAIGGSALVALPRESVIAYDHKTRHGVHSIKGFHAAEGVRVKKRA